jgi:hypothetical protein
MTGEAIDQKRKEMYETTMEWDSYLYQYLPYLDLSV